MDWPNVLTAAAAALGAIGTVWIAMVKARNAAATETDKLEQKQRSLELRLRQEQVASDIAQAEIETTFRREIKNELDRQSSEINTLRLALRASEEREHVLKLRILELEMELSRLRSIAATVSPAGAVGTTTTTTTRVEENPHKLGDVK
jgi:flagellar biosynthesis GTPase FlhF